MSTWKLLTSNKSIKAQDSYEETRGVQHKRFTPKVSETQKAYKMSQLHKSATDFPNDHRKNVIDIIDPLRHKKQSRNLQNSIQGLNKSGLFASGHRKPSIKKQYSNQLSQSSPKRQNPEKKNSYKKIIPQGILELEDNKVFNPLKKEKLFKLKTALQRLSYLKEDHQQMKKFINLQSMRFKIELRSTIDFLKRGLSQLSEVDNVSEVLSPKKKSQRSVSENTSKEKKSLEQIKNQAMSIYKNYQRQISQLQREKQALVSQQSI